MVVDRLSTPARVPARHSLSLSLSLALSLARVLTSTHTRTHTATHTCAYACYAAFPPSLPPTHPTTSFKTTLLDRVGQTQGGELTVPQRLACGASAGMTATTLTHPLDVIRVRLATDPKLTGFFDAIRQVSKQRAWFRGWSASVVSLGPFIGINFATFDTLKTWQYPDHRVVKPPVSGTLLLGATAGIIASSICFPLDTIRRRMQVSSGSGAGPKCV